MTFEFYYLDADNGGNRVTIGNAETVSLATDAFGVFSHILSLPPNNNPRFANQQVHLVISEGRNVISDELLKHVPYAIAANNGVPTGSIMPFVGETAPIGWVLCHGQSISGVNGAQNLIDLIGDNVPDLRGFFLRGAGTNPLTPVTTNLGEKQDDSNKRHSHNQGSLVTGTTGAHGHSTNFDERPYAISGASGDNFSYSVKFPGGAARTGTHTIPTNVNEGAHSHPISGNTGIEGTETESRPVSYGVNYIIKL